VLPFWANTIYGDVECLEGGKRGEVDKVNPPSPVQSHKPLSFVPPPEEFSPGSKGEENLRLGNYKLLS